MSCSVGRRFTEPRSRVTRQPSSRKWGGARLAVATAVPSREPTPDQTRGSCHAPPC